MNKFNLWPSGKGVEFVNKDKFDSGEILQKLGWPEASTTTSSEQIKIRQDGLKLLINNPNLVSSLREDFLPHYKFFDHKFFQQFGTDSPFFKKTVEFLGNLDKSVLNINNDLRTKFYPDLVKEISDEFQIAIQEESEIVQSIEEDMKDVYYYQGVVKFKSNLNKRISAVEKDVYGYQQYAFYKQDGGIFDLVKWSRETKFEEIKTQKNLWKMFLYSVRYLFSVIFSLFAEVIVVIKEKKATDAMYTKTLPTSVASQLKSINNNLIDKIRVNAIDKISQIPGVDKDRLKNILDSIRINTELQFILSPENGFIVKLVNLKHFAYIDSDMKKHLFQSWDWHKNKDKYAEKEYFSRGQSFYSRLIGENMKQRLISQSKRELERFLELTLNKSIDSAISESYDLLSGESRTLLKSDYLEIMDEVKFSNIKQAIEAGGLGVKYNHVLNFRQKIRDLHIEFRDLNSRAQRVLDSIKSYSDFDYCFPEIVPDDQNIVAFEKLMPIHLIGRKRQGASGEITPSELRPIFGLPPLNGKIISITGQNGGGKTVAEVELINAILLAHMGYPVFAKNFMLNPKDVVAMVFVEKGEGSMLQLLMEKLTKIAELIKKNDNRKVVVIIDELLTGTQEESGLEIGRKYLHMLAHHKCSVMFVTQITLLAKYAEIELNALSFHFNKDGKLLPGVGSGNAELLAKKMGLMEHIENY